MIPDLVAFILGMASGALILYTCRRLGPWLERREQRKRKPAPAEVGESQIHWSMNEEQLLAAQPKVQNAK